MKEPAIKYVKGDLVVLWKPHLCIHATKCWKGLPEVFDPRAKPWVNVEGASAERIIEQVKQCPSGALSFNINSTDTKNSMETKNVKIKVTAGGPLLVEGTCIVVNKDGKEEIKEGKFALCRCGQSGSKPYCDGSHRKTTFDN